VQYLRRPLWRRYAPFLILVLLDGWLLFGFSIVERYPLAPAGYPFFFGILSALIISAWFFSRRPGIIILRDAEPDEGLEHAEEENGQTGLDVLVKVLAGLTFFAAAFLWMMLMYRLDGFYITPDTFSYARVAEQPLGSGTFWAGERPISLPFLFQIFQINTTTLNDPTFVVSTQAKLFTQFQALLSIVSFTLLGLAASTHTKNRILRALIPTICVGFAMSIDVAQWNRMLVADSISLSFWALMLALALLALHALHGWQNLTPWLRILLPISFILSMALFSLTRDINACLLALITFGMLGSFLRSEVRRHASARAVLITALAALTIAGYQLWSFNQSERWVDPLSDVIVTRILSNPEAWGFFEENGAPLSSLPDSLIPDYCMDDCEELHRFLASNPNGTILLNWIRTDGKRVYAQYLLSQPVETLYGPISDATRLLSPDASDYRQRQYADPSWLEVFRRFVVPEPTSLILIWTLLVVVGCVMLVLTSHPPLNVVLTLSMVLLALFGMAIIWHGDGIELERHVMQLSLQLKLHLWIGTGFVLDGFLKRRHQAKATTKLSD